jgi:cytochrome c oxidase subunit IV
MTDDEARPALVRPALPALAAAFGVLIALTACELLVAGMAVGRAARITTLAGLMISKFGLVLSFFMHARASRRGAALALVSIGLAAAAAVVLMLETMFRVSVR